MSKAIASDAKTISAALKKGRATYTIKGHANLQLHANGDGTGSWWLRFRLADGSRKRHVISTDAKNLDPSKAYAARAELLEGLELRGVDPRNVHTATGAPTFSEAFESWLASPRSPAIRETTIKFYRGLYKRHVAEKFGRVAIDKLTKAAIREHFEKTANDLRTRKVGRKTRGKAATDALSMMRTALDWCIRRDLITINPADGIDYPEPIDNPHGKQNRAPTHDEVRRLWTAARTASSPMHGLAIQLTMLLGRRTSEVVEANRREFDLESGLWHVPMRTGNKSDPYTLPLSPMAVEMIRSAYAVGGKSEWLFPGETAAGHVRNTSVMRAFELVRLKAGVPDAVRLHDFRSLLSDRLYEAGVDDVLISFALNHTQEMKKVLARSKYATRERYIPKLRDAMNAAELSFQRIIGA
jgi:integrase